MPTYKVVKKCLLKLPGLTAPRICEVGETVRFEGEPGSCLHPLDREAEDRYMAWFNSKPAHVHKAHREHRDIVKRVDAIKANRAAAA